EILLSQRGMAGRDAAENRDAGLDPRHRHDLDPAGQLARALHVARALEHLQVIADAVGRVNLERLADLADRRWIAAVPAEALDVRENLSGAFVHVSVAPCRLCR